MKTEMEKCLAGEWYDCHNQVFLDLKTQTHKLLRKTQLAKKDAR